MPKLDHVLETALYVDDLDRAAAFYAEVFELPSLYADERLRAFAVGPSVLLLFRRGASRETMTMPGGTIPPHDGSGPCTSLLPSAPRSSSNGRSGCAIAPLRSRAAPIGRAAAAASISATPTDTCWNSPPPACGAIIEPANGPATYPNGELIACWRLGLDERFAGSAACTKPSNIVISSSACTR